MVLQTIESTREKDETVVSLDDAEVEADEAQDEFAGIRYSYEICHIKLKQCCCSF